MSFTFKSLFMETITSPRDAAQKIIDIGVSRQTSILSIVFTVCITVILFFGFKFIRKLHCSSLAYAPPLNAG